MGGWSELRVYCCAIDCIHNDGKCCMRDHIGLEESKTEPYCADYDWCAESRARAEKVRRAEHEAELALDKWKEERRDA